MDLGGTWRAIEADDLGRRSFPDPDLDDSDWTPIEVPGHWRSTPAFAASDGPLFVRRHFDAEAADAGRSWIRLDGIFYQGDVWLDGSYLGDTEGYFAPHTFEVTDALRPGGPHVLAVEVACPPVTDVTETRTLTGAHQGGAWLDPSGNPGGIWAPVTLTTTGAVRISALRIRCTDARPERATIEIDVDLDAAAAAPVPIVVVVRDDLGEEVARREDVETVAAGPNRVRRRLRIDRPRLWWPRSLGAQPLHTVEVEVGDGDGATSDRRVLPTGLRQVRMRGFVATVNGERLFLKGATYGPSDPQTAGPPAGRVAAEVALALDAGLDLLRVDAHIGPPDLYDAADRAGLLLWQDLPVRGRYTGPRREAVRQARAAVTLLGHHPSVLLWCGRDGPFDGDGAGGLVRSATRQAASDLDPRRVERSIRRALERADGSRPVIARSGVLPHPTGATDSQLWFGWQRGEVRDLPAALARVPVLGRFVGGIGARAVPDSDEWLDTSSWPDLDWEALSARHGGALDVLRRRVPPGAHATFDGWRAATQTYQAELVRRSIESVRRLKYRPAGGFTVDALADAGPSFGFGVVDHLGRPKAGFAALVAACTPVIVVADLPLASYRPGGRLRLTVHVVSDLRSALDDARVEAHVDWAGGRRTWRFTGEVAADSVVRIGALDLAVPDAPGPLTVALALTWRGGAAAQRYESAIAAG